MAEGRRSGAGDAAEGRRGGVVEDGDGGDAGVELSLRLRTGDDGGAAAEAARRSMTIFYNGRVCAVDVTELQARAIISMANQEILAKQHRQVQQIKYHDQGSGSSSNSDVTTAALQCGSQDPAAPVQSPAANCHASSPRASTREAVIEAVVAPMISQAAAGVSVKRSLQRFLEKRKTRAAAVAVPYAGGRQAQPMRH